MNQDKTQTVLSLAKYFENFWDENFFELRLDYISFAEFVIDTKQKLERC